ncbi:hypothetical protein RQP46_010438 [Phenoliferia psychrophenolica]
MKHVRLAYGPGVVKREIYLSIYLSISEHLARELFQQKVITVTYIPTSDMVTDVKTKSLPRPVFEKFRFAMGVIPLQASGGVATT